MYTKFWSEILKGGDISEDPDWNIIRMYLKETGWRGVN
jgi:hypothetical protein